jgi:hypothetical protein
MMPFEQIFKSSPNRLWRGRLATFDPGETTGFSYWEVTDEGPVLKIAKQLKTWPEEDTVQQFEQTLSAFKPTLVVFEAYRVYGWKTDQHSFSDVPTIQIIGILKCLCIQKNISYLSQTAQVAKQFTTDEKLEQWGFYQKGERHSRDAMRHACYFLLFGPKKS